MSQLAKRIVEITTGEAQEDEPTPEKRRKRGDGRAAKLEEVVGLLEAIEKSDEN